MASGYRGVFLIGNKAANRITDVQVVDAGGNTIPLPFAEYVARGAEPNYKTLRPAQLPEVERWSRAGQRVEEDTLFAGNSLAKAQRLFECFIKRRPKSRLTIRQRTRVLQEWPPSS